MEESEWALKYADERKMRMNLENRLWSLIYHTVPLVSAQNRLGNILCNTDKIGQKEWEEVFSDVMMFLADVQMDLHLNFVDSVGKNQVVTEDEAKNTEGLMEFEEDTFTKLHAVAERAARKVTKDWDKAARKLGMGSKDSVREHREGQIKKALVAMKDIAIKNVTNKKLEETVH